jgi:hypothetical protein
MTEAATSPSKKEKSDPDAMEPEAPESSTAAAAIAN